MLTVCTAWGGSEEKGEKETMAYVLAPQNVGPGSVITSSAGAKIAPGNTLPLTDIPLGTAIHNVELLPGRGGQLARAAGTSATLISRGTGPSLCPRSTPRNRPPQRRSKLSYQHRANVSSPAPFENVP